MDLRLDYGAADVSFDLHLEGADLAGDDGLGTAVALSLFTHRRAEPGDVLPTDETDRRGWWADGFAAGPGGQVGSRLWLLSRSKATPENVELARGYVEEALAWLVEDGVAERVAVTAEAIPQPGQPGARILALSVDIQRPQLPPVQFRFQRFWGGL